MENQNIGISSCKLNGIFHCQNVDMMRTEDFCSNKNIQYKMSKSMDQFLYTIDNKNTLRKYKKYIEDFFDFLNVEPDAYLEKTDSKKVERDIFAFITHIDKELHRAPTSIKAYLSIIRNFFQMNDFVIPERVFITLRRRTPRSVAIQQDAVPTKKILREIFQYGDFKMKCMAQFMLSSGMRLGETVGLNISDIEEYQGYYKVNIPKELTKSRYARITFISSEAKELLDQWLKNGIRKEYLRRARNKTNFENKEKVSLLDKRLFPMWDSTFRVTWINALEKSGYNERCPNTGHYIYHPHVLRKFFKTNLANYMNPNARDLMLGQASVLDKTYTDITYQEFIEKMFSEYKENEGKISVYTSGATHGQLETLEVELRNTKKDLDRFLELQKRFHYLTNKSQKDLSEDEKKKINDELGDINSELLDF